MRTHHLNLSNDITMEIMAQAILAQAILAQVFAAQVFAAGRVLGRSGGHCE